MRRLIFWGPGLLCGLALLFSATRPATSADAPNKHGLDWQFPNEAWMAPFKEQVPIQFVVRTQQQAEWEKLPRFWNEGTESTFDPKTGEKVERKVIRIKVPLGLQQAPPIPPENPMTVARWKLGKELYFDNVLSSDGTVSCATCHDPKRGYTDQLNVSTGIGGNKGGVSAPTVLNSAYHRLQFWDGRASSLEDQAQGPVQNQLEMTTDTSDHAWPRAVERVRKKGDYTRRFRSEFGTDPTRDAIAKAIATYERTVFSGNSIHDRAELAMRKRVEDEETGKYEFKAVDYENVLKKAFQQKDTPALKALLLDPEKDAGKAKEVGARINNGRALFFGKARCNSCHVGDNFTDNDFHNLGVGAKNGTIPENSLGRFGAQPTGAKNPAHIGAFKTPTVRGLVGSGPFLHDGSEKTLEKVIEFYDRGGNANEFLDVRMRDLDAERAYALSKEKGTKYNGPRVEFVGRNQTPIVPFKLNLTEQEKKDLVLFLRALEGDPVDPMVSDPSR